MKQPYICITGGHLTPALAVIEELQRTHPDWKLLFIGRRHVFEGQAVASQEERQVSALGVSFYGLTTGRFQRAWSPLSFISLAKIPIGIVAAILLLLRHRPNLILSFGGYIALPVVFAGAILNIPVVTHEQTEELGLANTIIARIARRVLLARDVGVPVRQVLFDTVPTPRPSCIPESKLSIVYMTGGSTGAQSLNTLIYPIIRQLIRSYVVIHQVGEGNVEYASRQRDHLSQEERRNYVVVGYIGIRELLWIYHHASLVVGRSGANTTAELWALGVPALCIPLPWAADREQHKNAQLLVDKGMAVVLDQQTLSGDTLIMQIKKMMQSINRYKKNAIGASIHYPRDGAARVVKAIEDSIAYTHHS